MGKLILTIEGVDLSQYFVAFSASPSGPGVIGSAELHLEKNAGGLDILIGQEVKLYFAFNAAGAGVQARGRIFGGVVAQRTEGNYGAQMTWVIACQDYNTLARSIAQPAAPVSEIVLSAGTFAAQILAVTEALQEQGHGSVNTEIDAVTHVADLYPTMPGDTLPPGKDLGWYYDYLCQTAQRLDPDLRPRWFLGPDATTFGVGEVFGTANAHFYDGALFPTAAFTHDESNIIESHSRTTGRGSMLVQKLQSVWASHNSGSFISTYTEDAAQAIYPNKWQNHDLTGDKGYWTAAAIEDSESATGTQATAALQRKVQALAYPSDTFEYYTMDWVKPGDVIDYSWDLSGHANEQLRCVGVAVQLENPDKLISRITLNTRRLTLFDTGEEFYAPPVEGDIIPPAAPASVDLDYNEFNEITGLTEVIYSWPASTSADTGGYRVTLSVNGGLAPWIDVGAALLYSTTVTPGATLDFYVRAYDTHNNISTDEATRTDTAAEAFFAVPPNMGFESVDPADPTQARWWDDAVTGAGSTVATQTSSTHGGGRAVRLTAVAGAGNKATIKSAYFKHIQTSSYLFTLFHQNPGGASADLKVSYITYPANSATPTTTTVLFTKTVPALTSYEAVTKPFSTRGLNGARAKLLIENITPGSMLDVDAGSLQDITTQPTNILTNVSANTTLDFDSDTTLVSASAAARTISLPSAASETIKYRSFEIKKTDSSANTVTIDPAGAETIDGQSTLVLRKQYQSVILRSNGTNWEIVASLAIAPATSTHPMNGNTHHFPPIGGNAASGDFTIGHSSTVFTVGQPPDEVLNISYNQDTSGNRVLSGESGLGLWLEGHYEPVSGTEYTEFQLRYTTAANSQQRPIEIRIDKNTNEVIHAVNVSELWWRTNTGSSNWATWSPTQAFIYNAKIYPSGNHLLIERNALLGSGELQILSWDKMLAPVTEIKRTGSMGTDMLLLNVGTAGAQFNVTFQDAGSSMWSLYKATNNDLNIYSYASATVLFTWQTSNNRVGVLNSSPAETLDVGGNIKTSGVYKVAGNQVVGARGAAVADATGAGDVVAQLNALLARVRAHGLIA